MATKLIGEYSIAEVVARRSPELNASELKALQFAADGEDCDSAARIMERSRAYLKNLRYSAQIKLGADNTTHAVALALRRGLIQ